jgi:hypothetical protein
VGNMMNQVNPFGFQPFVNVTLQGLQVVALKYLHFHQQRFSGDLPAVKAKNRIWPFLADAQFSTAPDFRTARARQ